jgi:hypothetical protein
VNKNAAYNVGSNSGGRGWASGNSGHGWGLAVCSGHTISGHTISHGNDGGRVWGKLFAAFSTAGTFAARLGLFLCRLGLFISHGGRFTISGHGNGHGGRFFILNGWGILRNGKQHGGQTISGNSGGRFLGILNGHGHGGRFFRVVYGKQNKSY